ncbi:MAG TPA: hypothetical protein VGQ30_13960 [Gemmatimonadaceae bacterium]|nr:hypothetical protein [Gemmatimonadaceae bacterium]
MGASWTPAVAQTALTNAAEGRTAPGGTAVVAIRAGTKVTIVSTKETSALVTIEGWVDASRLTAKVDTFPASVDSKAPLRVRASASDKGTIIAELRQRVGVKTLGKSGTWTRIRRSAWIPASALPKAAASVAAPKPAEPRTPPASAPPRVAPSVAVPQAESVASAPPATSAPLGAMSVTKATKLLAAPGGAAIADVPAGAVVQTLTHDHGFVKVRVEGWMPERELSPADNALGTQLTAADLRADPDGTRGKLVQWEVEVLSLQIADPLRRELARDEPYLLAKGPGTENALLYLAVPPSLLTQAKALPPLTRVLITARVRAGHSDPVGVPILDLRSISKR